LRRLWVLPEIGKETALAMFWLWRDWIMPALAFF
jgi:hypothetical protein